MKKIVFIILFLLMFAGTSFAFLYEVKILNKEEIAQLKNEQLVDVYTDVLIERQASETFHGRAGFTPKEYQSYKDLLGFVVRLRQEMSNRKMEPPPVSDWLK